MKGHRRRRRRHRRRHRRRRHHHQQIQTDFCVNWYLGKWIIIYLIVVFCKFRLVD